MEVLPAEQTVDLIVDGEYSDLSYPTSQPAILQHSTILQGLYIDRMDDIGRLPVPVASVMFSTCINLEYLWIFQYHEGFCLDLENAQG